jgi:hypothetical protein
MLEGTVRIFVATALPTKQFTAEAWLEVQGVSVCAFAGAAIASIRIAAAKAIAER